MAAWQVYSALVLAFVVVTILLVTGLPSWLAVTLYRILAIVSVFAAAAPVLSVTDQSTLEVTSTGGPPETVAEHVNVVVVDPNDAFALLGLMVIAVTLFSTITTVVVPVMAADDAEMVTVPEETPVIIPV